VINLNIRSALSIDCSPAPPRRHALIYSASNNNTSSLLSNHNNSHHRRRRRRYIRSVSQPNCPTLLLSLPCSFYLVLYKIQSRLCLHTMIDLDSVSNPNRSTTHSQQHNSLSIGGTAKAIERKEKPYRLRWVESMDLVYFAPPPLVSLLALFCVCGGGVLPSLVSLCAARSLYDDLSFGAFSLARSLSSPPLLFTHSCYGARCVLLVYVCCVVATCASAVSGSPSLAIHRDTLLAPWCDRCTALSPEEFGRTCRGTLHAHLLLVLLLVVEQPYHGLEQ